MTQEERAKYTREAAGLSIAEFAILLGTEESTVRDIEEGRLNLFEPQHEALLKKFIRTLSVDLAWLECGVGTMLRAYEAEGPVMDLVNELLDYNENNCGKNYLSQVINLYLKLRSYSEEERHLVSLTLTSVIDSFDTMPDEVKEKLISDMRGACPIHVVPDEC